MAERICFEDLNHRIEVPSRDPLVCQLTDTINNMIARLERAIRRQSVFISDASHEMRTPIAVIKGYADLIGRWGKDDPNVLQESIVAIQTEAERMNALIKSLLMLASSEEAEAPDKAWVSLNDVSREVTREMSLIGTGKNINIIENSREQVLANYDMILQLLRVFLDNCYKYAIRQEDPIEIIISGDENSSYLTVRDHGVGINEDDLPYIFERFYRADQSHSRRVPGFGLGLTVADMIARANGATIGVYSEPGAGTEFTVSFAREVS